MKIFASILLAGFWSSWCSAQPANDLCENAESITIGSTITGLRNGTTFDSIFCQDGQTIYATYTGVWYKVPGNGEILTADTCSNSDTVVSVFSDTCANPTCIVTNSFSCAATWETEDGVDYYIFVESFFESFELTLFVLTPAANDVCRNAESITIGAPTTGSIYNATIDDDVECRDGEFAAIWYPGVWYEVVGNGQVYRASVCDRSGYSISVFSGTCGDPTCIDAQSLGCDVVWKTDDGMSYLILVQSIQSSNFEIVVTELTPAANDLCENAESVAIGAEANGSFLNATLDNPLVCQDGQSASIDSAGLWYKVVGNGESLRADACQNNIHYLSVYSGTCANPICIFTEPFECSLEFESEEGVDYYILVQESGVYPEFAVLVTPANQPMISRRLYRLVAR